MKTLNLRNSIGRSPSRLGLPRVQRIWTIRGFLFLALGCFALSPAARAVLPPPAPDGGYPGDNTAEGTYALFSLTTGINNTAIGTLALSTVTDGESNTAIGAYALAANTGNFNTATGAGVIYRNT